MNKSELDKIKRFMADDLMQETVRKVLLKEFLVGRAEEDVNSKAARFIAIEKLNEAWKTLEDYRHKDVDKQPRRQIGL